MQPKILVQGNFLPEDLAISIGDSNRKIEPTIESQLEGIWEKDVRDAKLSGKKLYNGISYRLNSFELKEGKLHLAFAPIEYKIRDGLKQVPEYLTLSEPYWRKGCYTTGTIKTSDGKYMMAELSGKSMNSNTIDLIGGVVETEPKIIDGSGLFRSFYAELEEEALILESDIESTVLKALLLQHQGNIGIYFEVVLRVDSTTLKTRYTQNEVDPEIKEIKFFERSEFLEVLKQHNSTKQLVGEIIAI